MKILILSSSSQHFPLDIQVSLKEAGLDSHRLSSLNEFIASPLRREPFLAILEVGSTEDIDRALVAYEWAETVQPLATARYLLLLGSRHISLREKSSRFRGVEIAQLPLPAKNLMFKIDLQLRVLGSEAKAQNERNISGFSAEIREVERERVMVIRGPGPKAGAWKNGGDAPQGRIRWRWIDDPPKTGKPEEKFSWTAESRQAPVYNPTEAVWEVKDPGADLQCHRGDEEIFSAKKIESAKGSPAGPSNLIPAAEDSLGSTPESARAQERGEGNSVAFAGGTASPIVKNNLVSANQEIPASASDRPAQADNKKSPGPTGSLQGSPQVRASASYFPGSPNGGGPKTEPAAPSAAPTAETKRKIESSQSPLPVQRGSAAAPISSRPSPETTSTHVEFRPPSPDAEKNTPTTPASGGIREALAAEKKNEKNTPPSDRPGKTSGDTGTRVDSIIQAAPPAAPTASAEDPLENPSPRELTPPAKATPETPGRASRGPAASPPAAPATRESSPARPNPPEKAAPVAHSEKETSLKMEERPVAAPESASEPTAPAKEDFHSRTLRTDVIKTIQERPAERSQDTSTVFPERTREITGKIVLPAALERSEHQNLVRVGADGPAGDRRNISSQPEPDPENRRIKTRFFVTLSLEELQDQNSSWMPVEGYRIYLSAQHRYYGIKHIENLFPLWVYEGELPPEFLDRQKAWKFYDRLPDSYGSLPALPVPVARFILELAGARAETVPAVASTAEGAKAQSEVKYISPAGQREIETPPPPAPKKPSATFSPAWLIELLGRLLGR